MRRRALLLAPLLVRAAAARASPATAAVAPLAAEIVLDGRTIRFEEAAGSDLGDYRDPAGQFVQGCIRATSPDLPGFTVLFRRDRGPGAARAEVVFELGRVFSGPSTDLGAYRARILSGATLLGQVEVPRHFWYSRWRWQSAPRPLRATPAQLRAGGRLPPYDPALAAQIRRHVVARKYQVMELSGITGGMEMTGERDDIGPVTEQQAEYICSGDPDALAATLAMAEASGTLNFHARDEHTGAPLDIWAYPGASFDPRGGNPLLRRPGESFLTDLAHMPSLTYVAFLLTGDPYYLEALQFQANADELEPPAQARGWMPQVRAYAWHMRDLSQATLLTPETVPAWLLQKAYFRRFMDWHREEVIGPMVRSQAPANAIFHSAEGMFWGGNDGVAWKFWMDDFLAFVLCWMVMLGFDEWAPTMRWKLGATIARTDGRSGWPRTECSIYETLMRHTKQDPFPTSWAQAWALNAPGHGLDGRNPDDVDVAGDMTYFTYTRGVLVMADHLGIAEARPCRQWADAQLRRLLGKGAPMWHKWAVA